MQSAKFRVLIADDEETVRHFIKIVVRQVGLDLAGEATNGQEAVDLFRKEKPDLLLLDYNMPIKNGDEVLREITREFPDAKVVMLTSVADLETVRKCVQMGATNYMRKDMPVGQMRKLLKALVEKITLP